jgi:hypothetical protein
MFAASKSLTYAILRGRLKVDAEDLLPASNFDPGVVD